MEHKLHEITGFKLVRPFTLDVFFDDHSVQRIDFEGVLEGELYSPLKDPALFQRVRLDEELGNLVWPNGADFDPEILHDWPERKQSMLRAAKGWKRHTSFQWAEKPIALRLATYSAIGILTAEINRHVGGQSDFLRTGLLALAGSIGFGLVGDALASSQRVPSVIEILGTSAGAVIVIAIYFLAASFGRS